MYFCRRIYITWFRTNHLCICRDNRVRNISDNRRHCDILCVFAQWQSCEIKNHTMTYLVGVLRLQIWRIYLWFKHPHLVFPEMSRFWNTWKHNACSCCMWHSFLLWHYNSSKCQPKRLRFYHKVSWSGILYIQDMAIDNYIETIMFVFMFVNKIRTSGQEKRN